MSASSSNPRWPTRAEADAAKLFAPIDLNGRFELSARTWVPAMVPWRAGPDGAVTPELMDWYGRLARGKPGALVVEATGIRNVPSGPLLRIHNDACIAGLAALVQHVRRESQGHTRVFIQLIDFLRINRRPSKERYLNDFLPLDHALRNRCAAAGVNVECREATLRQSLHTLDDQALSRILNARQWQDLMWGRRQRVTDMDDPEIEGLPAILPALFTEAALRAVAAGFDGVELHAAHAYTLASFLSAHNTRPVPWGTTLEGRQALPLAVLQRIRASLPKDKAVGIRMSIDEAIDGGYGVQDATAFSLAFAKAGADFVSLSRGGKFEDARQPPVGQAAYPYTGPSGLACMPTAKAFGAAATGLNRADSHRLRKQMRSQGITIPVVLAGGLHTFEEAENALVAGDCDVIAAARQSLADPDWWQKLREGRGDAIRTCTMTNYCEGLDQKHKMVTCRLWDRQLTSGSAPGLLGAPTDATGARRLIAPPDPTSAI